MFAPLTEAEISVNDVITRMQIEYPNEYINPIFVQRVLHVFDEPTNAGLLDEGVVSNDKVAIGQFVKAVRTSFKATISQDTFGAMLTVSKSTIQRLEKDGLSPAGPCAPHIHTALNRPITTRRVLFQEFNQHADQPDDDGEDLAHVGDEEVGFPDPPIWHPGLPMPTSEPPLEPVPQTKAKEAEQKNMEDINAQVAALSLANSSHTSSSGSQSTSRKTNSKAAKQPAAALTAEDGKPVPFGDESSFGSIYVDKSAKKARMPSRESDTNESDEDIEVDSLELLELDRTAVSGGYVYVMKESDRPDRIKIGQSMNPVKRVQTLRVGNPEALGHVFYSFRRHRVAEKAIHAVLHELGRGIRGEWFSVTPQEGAEIVRWFSDTEPPPDAPYSWPPLPQNWYPTKSVFHITIRVQTEQSPDTMAPTPTSHVHSEVITHNWSAPAHQAKRSRCRHQPSQPTTDLRPRGGCNHGGTGRIFCKFSHDLPIVITAE